MRVATKSREPLSAACGTLAFGLSVVYYAYSLGALIMLECPSLGPEAPGHCAQPFWQLIFGFALVAGGALSLCWFALRALVRKNR